MTSEKMCRWGILSTAGIAQKNWEAIRNSGNGTVVAVASRDRSKAQQFIDDRQREVIFPEAPRALGSYEELIAADDIDAVYIPLPTGLRKEWVIRAAEAGKHVMCEKPCAKNAGELCGMIEACEANKVQFMDGVMYMHSERLGAIREALDDPANVGDLKRIATGFSFCAPPEFLEGNIRLHSDLEPYGCLGDLGWYTIRFALWVMNYQMPRKVSGRLLSQLGREDSPDSVPTEFSGELLFGNGVSSGFYNSFLTEHQQWAHISGSKGSLRVDDFVLPYFSNQLDFSVFNPVFDVTGCRFDMQRHDKSFHVAEYSNNHPTAQETKLFQRFGELVLGGQPDPHWPEIALKTQTVMDKCLESARNGGALVEISG